MVECTTATGWQVMRMAWSGPRELVNCSPADTSLSSDCRAGTGIRKWEGVEECWSVFFPGRFGVSGNIPKCGRNISQYTLCMCSVSTTCMYMFLMRDEKEERKKQARSNKQTSTP